MKHIKLYQTTSIMNADLSNLEKPYIAVAEDNLNSPIIEKYVAPATPVKIYVTSLAYNSILDFCINGTSELLIHETGTIPWGVDASTDFNEYSYYIEVNAGDEIKVEYSEGGNGFKFIAVDTGYVEDTETSVTGSNPATVLTVGNYDLALTLNN